MSDTPTPVPVSALAPPSADPHGAHPGARRLRSAEDLSAQQAAKRNNRRYLPTLFDRLCDDEPTTATESPDAYTPTRARMRDIIQRDLVYLLNTTNQADLINTVRYPQAARSTVNYGVRALAGSAVSAHTWRDIETMLRQAVLHFEPRLTPASLKVSPIGHHEGATSYNVLMFEISGYVDIQPYPMEFIVQSAVDLETSHIDLRA